jgi:hypothetical protein
MRDCRDRGIPQDDATHSPGGLLSARHEGHEFPFVFDASVVVCWFMPDKRHPIADATFRKIRLDPAVTSILWCLSR